MLKFFRNLFGKHTLHPAFIPNVEQFNSAKENAEKKISKIKSTQKHYDDKLKSLLTLFAKSLTTDAVQNKIYFEMYNKEWLQLSSRANQLNKTVKVNAKAFEVNAIALLNKLK